VKKAYEKPSFVKLQTGLMNKFGTNPYYSRKIRTEIDGVSVEQLTEKYGSPLFVYSEKAIRDGYSKLKKAFSNGYPNVEFGWSYKTNYLQAICAVMHQMGSYAEVVSRMEYDKAINLGVDPKRILFNGPHKSLDDLETAALGGSMIHLDHFDEIYDLEEVAKKLNRKIPVALRLNMDTGIYPQWSRFGFNIESGVAYEAAKRIQSGGLLEIRGLHSHIGTFIIDPAAYEKQIQKMVEFGYLLQDNLGFTMEFYDIGGGFPSKAKLKGSYLPPEISLTPLEEYAKTITGALLKALRPGDFPTLFLETGRAMIDEAGYLITSVFASKRLPDGRKAYIADAGLNLLFTSFWYRFTIEFDREVTGINEPSIIYGPLCMNIDVIDEGTLLPPLERGTRLILSPVGAYNQTQSMQFIEYRPAAVLITTEGKAEVIREAEDLTDIERREVLPEHLKVL